MNYLKFQLQLARKSLLSEIKEISQEFYDVQPKGFNNTIHWHIGHILTVTELLIFDDPELGNLPADSKKLFGNGTKPADWTADVPSVEVLIQQLKDQLTRMLETPDEHFQDKSPQPFKHYETVGEKACFSVFHEIYHISQIHVMKRIIEAEK